MSLIVLVTLLYGSVLILVKKPGRAVVGYFEQVRHIRRFIAHALRAMAIANPEVVVATSGATPTKSSTNCAPKMSGNASAR
jgi:hypothetical protein